MKIFTTAILISVLVLSFSAVSLSYEIGTDLIHIVPAYYLDKGGFSLHSHSFIYFKHHEYFYPNAHNRTITYWDLQGGVAAIYGAGKHLELGLHQILYQDNHKGTPGFNLPDDLFFSAKLSNIGLPNSPFRIGGLFKMRLPLAKHHNVVLEPYSSGRIEFNFVALISYYSNITSSTRGFSLHFNIGTLNHNDVGKALTNVAGDTISASLSSRQLLFGFAFCKNIYPLHFALEFSGNTLPQKPPSTAYSRETYIYLTPSVTYNVNPRIAFTTGMDIRLVNSLDETNYTGQFSQVKHNFDNYPPWRIYLRARVFLHPTEKRHEETSLSLINDIQEEVHVNNQIVQQLASEKQKNETAEVELERIREERERVARILEKLKLMIDTKKKNPPPKQ